MFEPRSFPQTGLPSKAGSNRAGARAGRNYIGALYVRLLLTIVLCLRCGALPDLCANEPNGTGMGLGE